MADSRQYMLWAFKMTGCTDCGYKPETVEDLMKMDCDHRDPETKWHIDSGGMTHGGVSLTYFRRSDLAGILEELWKCDPVCKACHLERGRKRAAERRDHLRPSWPVVPFHSSHREWLQATNRVMNGDS